MARRGVWSRGQRQGGVPLQRLGAPRPLLASSPESLPHHPGAPGPPGRPGERDGKQSRAPEERGLGWRAAGGGSPRKPRAEHPRFPTSGGAGWEVERSRVGGK